MRDVLRCWAVFFAVLLCHTEVSAVSIQKTEKPGFDADALSYKVLHTIKGSFKKLGPMQCESVCKVNGITASCKRPGEDDPCVSTCPYKCAMHNKKEHTFRYAVCVEGCVRFCGFREYEKME